MREDDRLRAENETLRGRLTRLTDAILRVSEDLDLDVVLQEIVDSARSLTDARYCVITTQSDTGELQDVLVKGTDPDEQKTLMTTPNGMSLFKYLSGMREPFRTADFVAHLASAGFPGFRLPIRAFLGTQIRVRNKHVGNIYIGEKETATEFSREDEETLAMFATQAAMAITNARRYGDEQRSKADLEALINTSPVGVLVLDAQTQQVMKVNQEARRIIGCTLGDESELASHIERLRFRRLDGSEVHRRELAVARAIRDREIVRVEEFVIERPDGTEVTTLVNATPIHAEDGKTVSIVTTVQDITPLEELERMRAEFLGMVSHELRAPLTSIKGSAATARGSPFPLDPAEARQFFRIIEEQADHMRDLINNLLDVTRIEAGTFSVAPEPTELATAIEQAINVFSSSGHRYDIEVEPMLNLPRIWGDRQRLVQVFYNLFSNAAKHSRRWSTITVTASARDPYVAISVTDEGAGIAAEQLPRLFSKFSRGDRGADNEQTDGYGLGLAICKGIVEAHGGRIWAESDGPGQGSRFTFTIPVVDEAAAGPATGPEEVSAGPSQLPTKAERILVIDDNPQVLRYVRRTLAEAGYTPTLTDDPAEVERLLAAHEPHLVLLDLVMPGTDGFELLQRIPRILNVPIIILSGRGDDRYVSKAFEMGAADYVVKPFSPTELLARVSAALRRQALAQHTEPFRLGNLKVDYLSRSVTLAGRPAKLTPTEYKLLFELCSNNGRVVTYEELLQRVWGDSSSGDPQRVRTFVKDLRRKLGDDARDPTYILTVPGIGYRTVA